MSKKKAISRKLVRTKPKSALAPATDLITDVRSLIEQARTHTAQVVNSALVFLYWSIGNRIRTEVLKNKRAEYGKEILATLSKELVESYGNGYSVPNLSRMLRLAEVFPDHEILSALSAKLGWSHFVEIIPLKDQLKRDFYSEMCRIERWSVRTLRDKIGGMLFERTALSRKPEKLAAQELSQLREADQLTPDLVFRDPYFLDVPGLKETYSENDLLFYHRGLRRLVAIDLKLTRFEPAHKGQMELYLRWLEKHEVEPGEESPLGLILCESAGSEQVELLQLSASGIRIGTYLTELPPRKLLEQKLHAAAQLARQQLRTKEMDELEALLK